MRTFILIMVLATQVCFAQQKPNIVLIMADDMGFSDIGCYGSEIPTPNIDKLAKGGIRLSQFYNTARCCPTRASLLTGLAPHQTGIGHMTEEPGNEAAQHWGTPGYQGHLNKRCVTIAEVLSAAGYHTYMAGKWHLGQIDQDKWPLQRGFEKYYGILSGAASYFKPQGGRGLTSNNTKLPPPQGNYYTTDAFADSAIAFLQQQQDDKPFFLYLAFNAPHWPLHAKPEDIRHFEGKYLKGWDAIRKERFARQQNILEPGTKLSPRDTAVRAWDQLTKQEQKDVAHRMAVYAAQVSCMDQNIGKLIATLDKQGKTDNTLIIFLSDNGACPEPYKELGGGAMTDINDKEQWGPISYGEGWANASNTPYRKWKREMEEGGMHTPFIMHWPKGITPGQINHTPSYLIDVMPTLISVSGAAYPATYKDSSIYPLEGRSILAATPHEYMFWEHEGNQAVRKGDWKAVKDRDRQWELFNLAADRTEEKDVSKQQPDILKDLTTHWENWANSHFVFPKH
jgi:arylsulfatase A-like enzyme